MRPGSPSTTRLAPRNPAGSHPASASEDPRRAAVTVVERPAHYCRVGIGGEHDRGALPGSPDPLPTRLVGALLVRAPPRRVKIHAAPMPFSSKDPLTMV